MISQNYDSHRFALQTEEIQNQIIASTEEQATQRIAKGTPVPAYVTAYKMSQAAYRVFEKRMNQEFPSPEYSDLLALTLMSRETPFLVKLKEKLEVLFITTTPQQTNFVPPPVV